MLCYVHVYICITRIQFCSKFFQCVDMCFVLEKNRSIFSKAYKTFQHRSFLTKSDKSGATMQFRQVKNIKVLLSYEV